ncbi:MAG: sigma-70 family RNA polymerase sigma factor [bacterium]|nr:sigma-70 family RNA polymerase sigma factor [bacterium]
MSKFSKILPKTSTTLLRELAADSRHARWTDFVTRYEPMMREYLRIRFPVVEADEVVAETLVALVGALAHYRYSPEETGRFHNYLTGILRHKALRFCRAVERERQMRAALVQEEPLQIVSPDAENDEEAYRQGLFEVAVSTFFAEPSIAARTKEVFRRTAIAREDPETVAHAFQMSRHAVDQIRNRSIAWLRRRIRELETIGD